MGLKLFTLTAVPSVSTLNEKRRQNVITKHQREQPFTAGIDPEDSNAPPSRTRILYRPWQMHNRKIILACGLALLPMLAFTLTFLGLVFSRSAKQNTKCAPGYEELCPSNLLLNTTSGTSNANYYVDYPSARLVFLGSLSSTISLSLVSVLMAIYSYSVAREMLRISQTKDALSTLPDPYQTSMLVRVLNGELLALWELGFVEIVRAVFQLRLPIWKRDIKAPRLLQRAILIFILCSITSLFIQAADWYLHISTNSVNFIQQFPEASSDHMFSRVVAPWCLNRPTVGSVANRNFWSCGLEATLSPSDPKLVTGAIFANDSNINRYDVGPSKDYVLNYTAPSDPDLQIALVGPPGVSSDLDWAASSFGVSTKCKAIPMAACTIGLFINPPNRNYTSFNCTKSHGSPLDVKGAMAGLANSAYYFDNHKYFKDRGDPFQHLGDLKPSIDNSMSIGVNLTDEDANDVFRNPWRSLNMVSILEYMDVLPKEFSKDNGIWRDEEQSPYAFMMLDCNTTVWDIDYAATNRIVSEISRKKSNGTMAGIPSMATLPSLYYMPGQFDDVLREASLDLSTPSSFLSAVEIGMSKVQTLPLAAQTVGHEARIVQRRTSKVITQIPKAAFWGLVVANLLFSILGFALTIMALMATSPSTHQVRIRLGVAGLVAQLFESKKSEWAADDDVDLFKIRKGQEDDNYGGNVKVGVRRTNTGGSLFTIVSPEREDGGDGTDEHHSRAR